MDDALKTKLDAAKERVSNKFPAMRKAKAEFPDIRKVFGENEMAQIKERYKEIDPSTFPREIDPNSEEEIPPQGFAFEYYFLKNLLDS